MRKTTLSDRYMFTQVSGWLNRAVSTRTHELRFIRLVIWRIHELIPSCTFFSCSLNYVLAYGFSKCSHGQLSPVEKPRCAPCTCNTNLLLTLPTIYQTYHGLGVILYTVVRNVCKSAYDIHMLQYFMTEFFCHLFCRIRHYFELTLDQNLH